MWDDLTVTIPPTETWDPVAEEFRVSKGETITLKHSLISMNKWESKWCKPFMPLTKQPKTYEETIDYIRCMTVSKPINPEAYYCIPESEIKRINEYIESPMTATTIRTRDAKPNRQQVTAELIYYWMISYGIPFECEKWHLNRLMTLIRVCSAMNESNNPKAKRPKPNLAERSALNAARRKQLHTSG